MEVKMFGFCGNFQLYQLCRAVDLYDHKVGSASLKTQQKLNITSMMAGFIAGLLDTGNCYKLASEGKSCLKTHLFQVAYSASD